MELKAYTKHEIEMAGRLAIPGTERFYVAYDVDKEIDSYQEKIKNLHYDIGVLKGKNAALNEENAKIRGLAAMPRWDNSTVIATLIEKNKDLENELEKQKQAYLNLDLKYQHDTGMICKALYPGTPCSSMQKVLDENKALHKEIAKKGAANLRLECEKRDLWLRFVQLRRALCRLRIAFALRFGGANLRKKIVAYWTHRGKTAPYWDSKTYKDIPQTKE